MQPKTSYFGRVKRCGIHVTSAVLAASLTACATQAPQFQSLNPQQAAAERALAAQGGKVSAATRALYAAARDGGHDVPAIPDAYLAADAARRDVPYHAPFATGTIVVDPGARALYHLRAGQKAMRYKVGVGAAGRAFSGEATIPFQKSWPFWTPTPQMLRDDPATYAPVRAGLPGGPNNPLGARALYLYQNDQDTLYRIHGTPYPWSVGTPSTAGCIRMFNQDVIHLAAQVSDGTRVVVLDPSQAGKWTGTD